MSSKAYFAVSGADLRLGAGGAPCSGGLPSADPRRGLGLPGVAVVGRFRSGGRLMRMGDSTSAAVTRRAGMDRAHTRQGMYDFGRGFFIDFGRVDESNWCSHCRGRAVHRPIGMGRLWRNPLQTRRGHLRAKPTGRDRLQRQRGNPAAFHGSERFRADQGLAGAAAAERAEGQQGRRSDVRESDRFDQSRLNLGGGGAAGGMGGMGGRGNHGRNPPGRLLFTRRSVRTTSRSRMSCIAGASWNGWRLTCARPGWTTPPFPSR